MPQILTRRDHFRIGEAAKILGVSEHTLRNWDQSGKLQAYRHPINGYRMYRAVDLHSLLKEINGEGEASRRSSMQGGAIQGWLFNPKPLVAVKTEESDALELLPKCHWSHEVALDPKHRPQRWDAPSSTVRRDWRKFPQEAHVLDVSCRKYRRLAVEEIALLQGFDPKIVQVDELTERERIAALGDAVPPALAIALARTINEIWRWKNRTAVELCAGIGGLATGAAAIDLEHLMLVDNSEVCGTLLRRNRSWSADRVRIADLRTVDFRPLRDRVGLLSGGPPCQPWSASGHRLGETDERDLLKHIPELVSKIRPEVFLFENVPGLTTEENLPYLAHIVNRLRKPDRNLDYGVLVALLNAADFGIPQIRRRIFILGFRESPAVSVHQCFDRIQGKATHRDPTSANSQLAPWKTVGDAIGDLPDPGGWRRWILE